MGIHEHLEHQGGTKKLGSCIRSASKLYYQEMVTFFPELGYCDGNWKCDVIATASYTSWCKNHISHLVCEGTYKPTAEDILDFNNLKMLDSDDTDSATGDVKTKKQTHDSVPLSITSTLSKKRKPSEILVPEHELLLPLPMLPLPDSDKSQPTDLGHSDNMNKTCVSKAPTRFHAWPLKFANLLTTLELTTSADQLPPSPSEDIPTLSTAPVEEPISTQPTGEHTPSIALTPEYSLDYSDICARKEVKEDADQESTEWMTGSAAKFKTYYNGLLEAQKNDTTLLPTSCNLEQAWGRTDGGRNEHRLEWTVVGCI
ncbi:hypothetical protein EV702DRAFT_1043201 [Suillus placidus]|uniref:Uncharacterized protein n=1 Tax=Suillus placidus TaxID=48579 RepID=A0A9P7A178_9AGAM|nr:hypothetical protein EV702DRAFT_1043201 [Suillus placidus]